MDQKSNIKMKAWLVHLSNTPTLLRYTNSFYANDLTRTGKVKIVRSQNHDLSEVEVLLLEMIRVYNSAYNLPVYKIKGNNALFK